MPDIGVWCNGNTADSGPAFPGSSPGTPTSLKRASSTTEDAFFVYYYKSKHKAYGTEKQDFRLGGRHPMRRHGVRHRGSGIIYEQALTRHLQQGGADDGGTLDDSLPQRAVASQDSRDADTGVHQLLHNLETGSKENDLPDAVGGRR